MELMESSYDRKFNSLIQDALKGKYCEGCPNRERVIEFSERGIFPRWGAGNIQAPIYIFLERPGDQLYLCETEYSLEELSRDINQFRLNFTEIMYSVYTDAVRYLDGIMEYIYDIKSRKLSIQTRLKILQEITFMTEVVKCPGKLDKNQLKKINLLCPSNYLRREWQIVSEISPQRLKLVIFTTGLTSVLPSNFPEEVRKLETHESYHDPKTGITYLKIWHPSYLSRNYKNINQHLDTIYKTRKDLKIPTRTDRGVLLDLRYTLYILHHLSIIPNSKHLKNAILQLSPPLD